VLKLEDLQLARGSKLLINKANVQLHSRERAALVGRNGTGKSSLLAAICDEAVIDGGDLHRPPLSRIVKLEQITPYSTLSSADYVIAGDRELAGAQAASLNSSDDALAQAMDKLTELQAWSAPARARILLTGLGFSQAQCEQSVNELSGGWKMRLNLARVLMAPGDLLLLDEPTNHLDLDAIIWLQDWLRRFQGATLLVSHDREFVDAVADCVWHLEHDTITRYAGGYSSFEEQALERAELRERTAQAQETRIAHLTSFVERFRAKATKAKQAQSRLKALERIERVQKVSAAPSTAFRFEMTGEGPDPIVVTDRLNCGYGQPLLRNIKLSIRKGERIGVLGRNGAGKTTLIRTLVGELKSLGGTMTSSKVAKLGYFAQGAIEALNPESSALEHMRRLAPERTPQELRDYLAPWGFRGDLATDPIAPFSGGEKSRLALAMLAWTKPHVLILDEPTNHLDAQARDALTLALADYPGALLLVSHDRALLRTAVDRFVLVADGTLQEYEGDLDDYTQWLVKKNQELKKTSGDSNFDPVTSANGLTNSGSDNDSESSGDSVSRKDERRLAAQERLRLNELKKPLEKAIAQIEKKLNPLQSQLALLDQRIADPALYDDAGAAAQVTKEHGQLRAQIEIFEIEWLNLSEQLEAIV
jgi:ATP-binding cassette, subfamily F, member 3